MTLTWAGLLVVYWRKEYNLVLPHNALKYYPPASHYGNGPGIKGAAKLGGGQS
jgi:hypothetical protein